MSSKAAVVNIEAFIAGTSSRYTDEKQNDGSDELYKTT